MTDQKKFDEMSIWDLYETDLTKETEGFWHKVNKKIKVKLARAGGANMSFTKAMEEKTREHRKRGGAFEGENVDVELATDLMKQAFAETIILDWKGFTNKAGKTVAYTPKVAYETLVALPDLFIELRDAAGAAANYRIEDIQDDVGN
jgi:hypothetical protein